ncbi:Protein CBG06295 [Caenorhabditis briggsae]|uniref:Protein CBG06295 n=1 Tax=Caenorhabditis briggsae TaxID=6238 RepID=A8X1W3_CAEBR|nr:Protein CBG06295 [Caenorhabditis briggsae]CAP26623.2 Protein CBG06295 [Caenorhabditis briggsae]
MVSFEKYIYPIRGKLRFETDQMEDLNKCYKYGNAVKLGKTEWCLIVATECSPHTQNQKCFSIFLKSLYNYDLAETISGQFCVYILKNSKPEKARRTKFVMNEKSTGTYGFPNFLKWDELMNDGYVENGKIVIEAVLSIEVEQIFNPKSTFFDCRPNSEDLKVMLEPKEEGCQIKSGRIIQEVEMAKLKDMNLQNLWWRVEAAAEIHIKSRLHPNVNISFNVPPKLFLGSRSYGSFYDIWDFLMDQESGYLSIGKILVEIRIDVRKKYGFECPQKPIRKMTDSVILIDGEEFHVSRSLLSHHSSVLCDLFTGTPDIPNFLFDEISKELFVKFLELVHDWKTEIDEKNIEKLLKCLNLLEADECIKLCDNLMVRNEFNFCNRAHFQTFQSPNEPYYSYVKRYPKLPNVLRPTGEFQFEFVEKTREMLEDPEMEHIGNEVLLYLSRKSNLLKNMCSRVFFKEFSDPLDMVVFHFEDGKSFYASKQFSQHFMREFYGPKYKGNDNEIKISDVKSEDFEMFLTFIYRPNIIAKKFEKNPKSPKNAVEKERNSKKCAAEGRGFSVRNLGHVSGYSCYNYRAQNLSKVKREKFFNEISKVETIFSLSVGLLSTGLAFYFTRK